MPRPWAVTDVAAVHPDPVPVVLAVALHGVVGEVALCHLEVGVNDDLRGTDSEALRAPAPGPAAPHQVSLALPAQRSGCLGYGPSTALSPWPQWDVLEGSEELVALSLCPMCPRATFIGAGNGFQAAASLSGFHTSPAQLQALG